MLIIILLTLIYGYLIYLVIVNTNFERKIILVLSILIFFIVLQLQIFQNLGYPSSDDLPKNFKLISVHKLDEQKSFIILATDLKIGSIPRLYMLNYSRKLDATLSKALGDIGKGYNIIGEITDDQSQNYYGIQFKRIKKQLPLK